MRGRPKRQQRGMWLTTWHWLPRGQMECECLRPNIEEEPDEVEEDDDDAVEQL